MTTTTESRQPAGMSRSLTFLFALASGIAVGNLYWAQPLLHDIAQVFGVSVGSAGLLVTVTQVGYAIGVMFVLPLGDTVNRSRLIPVMMGCSAIALLACAFVSSFLSLLIMLALVGLTTVTGQMLIPLAGDLARDDQRGHVVATVVSGVVIGILASRSISGLLADAFGWRVIYIVAAVITAGMAVLLANALPTLPARMSMRYGKLLQSVFSTVRQHRTVQVTMVLNGINFSVFSMFWTALTFLLSAPPFSYSGTQIGLVGLVGFAGALSSQRAGGLHDRGWSVPATGLGLALTLLSLTIAALGADSIIVVLIAITLFSIANSVVNVLNQIRVFSVDPAARSRLNTAFVTCNFVGGAIGSTLAGILWELHGWLAVSMGGGALITLALLVWTSQRKRSLAILVPTLQPETRN